MATLLYSEINLLCIAFMLTIVIKTLLSGYDKLLRDKMFIISVLFATVSNVCDFFWNLGATNFLNFPVPVRQIINFSYFISFGFAAYFWFIYAELAFNKGALSNKKRNLLRLLPIAALAGLLIVSHFNGCLYYFDENRIYHRGALYYMQHILSFSYIIAASFKCLVRAFQKKHYSNRDEYIMLTTFVLPPVICCIIQAILQNLPIMSVGIVISFQLAYIDSLEQKISSDPLTGISNRREFLRLLSDDTKSPKPGQELYFLFIDVDDFKRINDTFGHNEGDRILTALAAELKKFAKEHNGYCGRYGGDEFAMVLHADAGKPFTGHLDLSGYIRNSGLTVGGAQPVEVSVGYACYREASGDLQQLISRADHEMYRIKSERKRT